MGRILKTFYSISYLFFIFSLFSCVSENKDVDEDNNGLTSYKVPFSKLSDKLYINDPIVIIKDSTMYVYEGQTISKKVDFASMYMLVCETDLEVFSETTPILDGDEDLSWWLLGSKEIMETILTQFKSEGDTAYYRFDIEPQYFRQIFVTDSFYVYGDYDIIEGIVIGNSYKLFLLPVYSRHDIGRIWRRWKKTNN